MTAAATKTAMQTTARQRPAWTHRCLPWYTHMHMHTHTHTHTHGDVSSIRGHTNSFETAPSRMPLNWGCCLQALSSQQRLQLSQRGSWAREMTPPTLTLYNHHSLAQPLQQHDMCRFPLDMLRSAPVTHTHTHARTHAHTHTHTHMLVFMVYGDSP